jgi:pimeloyl-ACP methyl ester carboxylesterase
MGEVSSARYRAGDGEPVLLLHGFTATWRCWLPVLPELAARYDVLAPTLTGHDGGPEILPGQAHDLPAAADHVEAELEAQGFGTAHMVGNSMGGALVLELAKRGRARSVVALSPGGGWHPGDGEGERIERFFRRQLKVTRMSEPRLDAIMRRPMVRRAALRDIMRRGEQLPPSEAVALARSSLRCTVVDDVFQAIRSGGALLRDLDQVRAPTLVAWAQYDRVLPMERHAQRFRTEIPGVTFRVLPGVGHVPMSDDPRLVVDTIVDWVERHRGAGEDAGEAKAAVAARGAVAA